MRKRILALLLALVMCLSLLPTAVFAEDVTTDDTTGTGSSTITDTTDDTTGGGDSAGNDDTTTDTTDDTAIDGDSTGGDDTTDTTDTTGAPADSDTAGEDGDGEDDSDEAASAPAPLLGAAPVMLASTGEHKHGESGNPGTAADEIWTAWTATDSLPNTTGYYYLTANVELSEAWWPKDDTYLCLNGHNITLNEDDDVIKVASLRSFTLTDCQGSQGKITHAEGKSGRGVLVMDGQKAYPTEFRMYGGHITGNTTTMYEGGGVNVMEYGKFLMSGGTISDNSAKRGGGVCLDEESTFLMSGGSIENNHATEDGGGVYNLSNSFIMSGGSIKNNTAERDGGGVYGAGAIHKFERGDKAPQYSSDALTTFLLWGSANVTDNTVGGKANNLYVPDWLYSIDVAENFTGSFGVTVDEAYWSKNIVASPDASTPYGPEYIWGKHWQVINCAGGSLPTNVTYDNDHFAIESHAFAPKKLVCKHCSAAGTIEVYPINTKNTESYIGCPICKKAVAAEVTFTTGGETQSRCFDTVMAAYYAAATPTNTANATTMKLLADGSLVEVASSGADSFPIALNGRSITINLNGKKLKVNSQVNDRKLHLMSGTLTIMDSGTDGAIEALSTLVVDKGANLVLNDGTLSGALTVKSGGHATLSGSATAKATVTGALTVEKNGTLEINGKDGGRPIINTLDVQSGGRVTLKGVMFQKITVADGVIADILAPNHSVFYYTDGYYVVNANAKELDAATVTGSNNTSLQVLTNDNSRHYCRYTKNNKGECICECGRICTHGSINNETGRCVTCGSTIMAQVSPMFNGGSTVYYPTLNDAAASSGNMSIIKLLADVNNADVTLQSTLVTLDLNGKKLSGRVSVGGEESMQMITFKGNNLKDVELTVQYTYFTWQDESGAIGSKERKLKSLTLKNSNAVLQLGANATIGTLKNDSGSPYALSKLLPEGYVLKYSTTESGTAGNIASRTQTIAAGTTWYNATTEICAHGEYLNAETGYCSRCEKQFKVRVQAGGSSTYYDKLSDAAAYIATVTDTTDITIKLLTDVTERIASVTQEISLNGANPLTLDLNGKTLTANITVPAEGKLTMSSAGKLDGTLAVNGGTVELSGGTFNEITVTGENKTVGSLLKDGYGYRSTNGWVTDDTLVGAELSNVSVERTITVSVTTKQTSIGGTETATLTATVVGAADGAAPTYAWYKVGTDGAIFGQTEASYTTPAASELSAGEHKYYCTATVDGYTATSNTVTITVQGTLTPDSSSGESGGEGGGTSSGIYTVPTGQTGLTYTGEELELINAGEVPNGCTMKYRLGTTGDFTQTIPTATDAGTYTVYWYIDGGTTYTDVHSADNPAKISVTIARSVVSLDPSNTYAETGKQVSIVLKSAVGTKIPSTEALTFTLASGAPSGMSVSGSTLTFLPAADGTYTATVSVTSKNYSGSLAVQIVSNTKQNPSVTVEAYTKAYDGTAVTLDKIQKTVTTKGVTGTWSWTNKDTAPKNVADSAAYQVTFTPDEAYENTYNPVTVPVQVTINPVTLTVEGTTTYHPTKAYDGSMTASTEGLSLTGTVAGETLAANTDYTISAIFKSAGADTNKTVYVTVMLKDTKTADNYSLTSNLFTARGTIDPETLTLAKESGYTPSKTYDGTVTASTGGLSLTNTVNGETLTAGTDYTISAVFDSAAVGPNKTVTITVTLQDTAKAANYCFKVDGSASRTMQETMTADIYPIVLTTPPTAKVDPVKLTQDVSVRSGSYPLFGNVNVVLPEGVTIDLEGELRFTLGNLPAKVKAAVDETTGMLTYTINGGKAGDNLAIPVTVTMPNFVQQDASKEENRPATRGVNDAPQELDPNADALTLSFTVEIELTGRSQQVPDNDPFEPIRRPTGGNGSGGSNGGSGGASGNGSTSGNGGASGNAGTTGSTGTTGNGSASGSGVASPGTGDAGIVVYAMLSLSAALGMCATGCTIFSRKRRRG